MATIEPQSANEYDDRTATAVKSVLLEMGQILGSFEGKFAIIGGAVPWLLDGEYARLVETLQKQGYEQRDNMRRFQLVRTVPEKDAGGEIDIVVDFLMPRDAEIVKNKPPLVSKFAVQRADGAELATQFYKMVAIDGEMPDGGTNTVRIAVASIPALLAMKGYAINNRLKRKDAYDIYYSIRNFPGGIQALAEATGPLMEVESAREGFTLLAGKFESVDGFGPTCVRQFVENSEALGERTAEQWQQDAFGQVNAWLSAIGLR